MSKLEEPWDHDRPGPPLESLVEDEVSREEDSPAFAAIRRIELLGRLHHMAFRTLLSDGGLSPAQAGAMNDIIRSPGMSQRELADKLHIQRATATVMLQKMEKAGLIDRRPDREDQRISRIYPTGKAMAIDAENKKNINAYFDRLITGLPPEDFRRMMESLAVLRDNMRAILDGAPESLRKE